MANKRNLKKQIKYICGDLAVESAISIHTVQDIDVEKMKKVISDVAELQVSTLKKCSFSFDKVAKNYNSRAEYNKSKSAYFKAAYDKLVSSFNNSVKSIVKQMNEALPAAQKEANKAAATKHQ
ncbi:MAG: hypothetical protein J6C78_05790 [Muribaculaceae bacterium]|nr:hypothetical protein [Muribaculaceae bacterium]